MRIPAHSPGLPGYINVMQMILVILKWLDFFQIDLVYTYIYMYKLKYDSAMRMKEILLVVTTWIDLGALC